MKTYRLALIGSQVSLSKSDDIHTFIMGALGFGVSYERISLPSEEFPTVFPSILSSFDGCNVTIPYKDKVGGYLRSLSKNSEVSRSVNTIVCKTAHGDTTDGVGFLRMLEFYSVPIKGASCVIVGAGGAGRSLANALLRADAKVYLTRRNRKELEEDVKRLGAKSCQEIPPCDILVNATALVDVSPVSREDMQKTTVAVELAYKTDTAFLSLARGENRRALDGNAMLFYQAYYSDCLYLGKEATKAEADELYEQYLRKKEKKHEISRD